MDRVWVLTVHMHGAIYRQDTTYAWGPTPPGHYICMELATNCTERSLSQPKSHGKLGHRTRLRLMRPSEDQDPSRKIVREGCGGVVELHYQTDWPVSLPIKSTLGPKS
jgi:hypothetical protein